MTEEVDVVKFLQQLSMGRLDDHLEDVAAAVGVRVKESMRTLAWRFRLDGVDVNELEVTLQEWSEIQKASGVHMLVISPEVNVDHLIGVGSVLLQTRGGLSADEAAARVGSLTARDVPDVVTREVVDAPFDSPTPSTT